MLKELLKRGADAKARGLDPDAARGEIMPQIKDLMIAITGDQPAVNRAFEIQLVDWFLHRVYDELNGPLTDAIAPIPPEVNVRATEARKHGELIIWLRASAPPWLVRHPAKKSSQRTDRTTGRSSRPVEDLGSYFSVSIALIVCRDTPSLSARSCCDQSRSARRTFRRFFTGSAASRATGRRSRRAASSATRDAGSSRRD